MYIINPIVPSAIALKEESMIGFAFLALPFGIGVQSISLEALWIENLKDWSNNRAINMLDKLAKTRKEVEPIISPRGIIIKPPRIPNFWRMNPVRKSCIMSVVPFKYM